ncbi:MAG: GTP-sensing pleiotropic transcriptional regulator CodY [Clostridiales bacterium]|nr:GTP-sensing pleiotropic transcriptional regulator CodY [Clostridiales bacterium]
MSATLLGKIRRINKILQNTNDYHISFNELSRILSEILDANVYVASVKGKVLGVSLKDESNCPILVNKKTGEKTFSKECNDQLLKFSETESNITGEALLSLFKDDVGSFDKLVTITPIYGSGERLGTLILARHKDEFIEDDLVMAEYSSTVIGLEVIRAKTGEKEEETRKRAVIQMAIGTLSYSEFEAVEHIFNELNGMEGLLVASKVADRVGITRSVIVNALRKFESAGVIVSRSLGMKGTHIKILNNYLLEALRESKQ